MVAMSQTMKVVYLLLYIVAVALASSSFQKHWQEWKGQHGKKYLTREEELERRVTWARNLQYIENFNRENRSYKLGMNHFADMSHEEFVANLLENINVTLLVDGASSVYKNSNRCMDDCLSLDWRNEGFTTQMTDQGICQSSWAFSAAGATDGQVFVMTGSLMETSVQQLLDCSFSFGNRGCHGGIPTWAYKYIESASGVCPSQNYPYLGYTWYCAEKFCSKPFTCMGFAVVETGNEDDLMGAVTDVGPISVVVDALPVTFQYYSGGVYNDYNCRSNSLNHAMLLVGYGVDAETGYDYWLLKNSWGSDWGIGGYMMVARNKSNLCGVATAASYPILKQT